MSPEQAPRHTPGQHEPRHLPGNGGGERNRTDDPLLAKQVLYQLSYTPLAGITDQAIADQKA
jgi:hypothetical protein